MDFAAFHGAYETLVEKARTNKLMPDDFAGATMQLTNPGGLGTVASVPRLMAGQGSIIAVGAIGYPAEFASVPESRLSRARRQQSHDHHQHLRPPDHPGRGIGHIPRDRRSAASGRPEFYDGIAKSLGADDRRSRGASGDGPAGSVRDGAGAGRAGDVGARRGGHGAGEGVPNARAPRGPPRSAGHRAARRSRPRPCLARAHAGGDGGHSRQGSPHRRPRATLAESLPYLQATYCGTMAYEIEHISTHEERVWLREKIESGRLPPADATDRQRWLLQRLTEVEALERFLHKAYLGQKRFSIEGVDMLVPMLDRTIESAAESGARDVVIGMAHRGRLNVLAHTVGRPYETIFAEFEGGRQVEGGHPTPEGGTGDVKYHHGAEGAYKTAQGKAITVSLSPNPSHLEYVSPVVDGRARANKPSGAAGNRITIRRRRYRWRFTATRRLRDRAWWPRP